MSTPIEPPPRGIGHGKLHRRQMKDRNGEAEFIKCPECGVKRYGIKGVWFFHPCDNCKILNKLKKRAKVNQAKFQ